MRWTKSNGEFVSPVLFIPLAEKQAFDFETVIVLKIACEIRTAGARIIDVCIGQR